MSCTCICRLCYDNYVGHMLWGIEAGLIICIYMYMYLLMQISQYDIAQC